MELNLNGKIARMFSTVTTVATPHDVTLQELHVEVFYPADAETGNTPSVIRRNPVRSVTPQATSAARDMPHTGRPRSLYLPSN